MTFSDEKFFELIGDFCDIVYEEFDFLVTDFGFVRSDVKKKSFEHSRDAHIQVDYAEDHLCVRIEWYFVDASMGVGLIELTNGKIPGKFSYFENEGYSRAIDLSTLVEYLTEGEVRDPLPSFGPSANARKITKAWKERKKLIEDDKRSILTTYARWLRTYGYDVLSGDTSIFGPVWTYAAEKIARDYYG